MLYNLCILGYITYLDCRNVDGYDRERYDGRYETTLSKFNLKHFFNIYFYFVVRYTIPNKLSHNMEVV